MRTLQNFHLHKIQNLFEFFVRVEAPPCVNINHTEQASCYLSLLKELSNNRQIKHKVQFHKHKNS